MGNVSANRILVRRMAAGDRDALSELYRRFATTIYALAYGLVFDPQDADQVLTETFERAWQTAVSYDPTQGSVRAWLTQLSRRAVNGLTMQPRHRT